MKKSLSLLAILLSLMLGCKKETVITEPNTPQGRPPSTPDFYQVVALAQEPVRGMNLSIYDASDDEDGFRIERKKQGGSYSQLVTLPANASKYDDWGLEISTQYTYRIQAYNSYGNSDWSEKTQTSAGSVTNELFTYVTSDAWVENTNPNSNYGNTNYLQIAGANGPWGGQANILLMFILPSIPAYAHSVQSATLRLCEAGGGNTSYPGSIYIYAAPILDSWNGSTVTWNNRPGTWLSTNGQASHNPNNTSCVTIDVSNVVSDWYNGVRQNRGFMLFSSSNSYSAYYSKEGYSSGSALLQVYYTW